MKSRTRQLKFAPTRGRAPFFCVLQGADGKLQKSMIRTCLLVLMLPSLGAVAGLDRTLDAWTDYNMLSVVTQL